MELEDLEKINRPANNCCVCGNPIPVGEGANSIGGKPACDDCYFGEFGEEIEKHPIVNPILSGRLKD